LVLFLIEKNHVDTLGQIVFYTLKSF